MTATNRADALRLAAAQRPDLIVLDLTLADSAGVALHRELQDMPALAATPVVFLSDADRSLVDLPAGATSVSKPRTLDELWMLFVGLTVSMPARPSQRPGVLVTDDDPVSSNALAALLRGHGYDVTTASSGEAALSALQTRPDLAVVILDVMMPELDGLTVTRRIRASCVALASSSSC